MKGGDVVALVIEAIDVGGQETPAFTLGSWVCCEMVLAGGDLTW